MPRPKTTSDEAILEVARRCFERFGHGASTRDIAKEAGVSQAVLYQRFGSKEELFIRAMMPATADIEALLKSAPGDSTQEALKKVVWGLYLFLRERIPLAMNIAAHPSIDKSHLAAAHGDSAQQVHRALASKIEAFQKEGELSMMEPELVARTLISVAHSVAAHDFISGGQDKTARAARASLNAMVEVVWRGLKP